MALKLNEATVGTMLHIGAQQTVALKAVPVAAIIQIVAQAVGTHEVCVAGDHQLGAGYAIAVLTKNPLNALLLFFVAVLLVIIGTYLLFTSGSIAVLKLLKKSVVDKRTAVIFVIVLLGNMLLSVSPVWFVLLSALSGIVLKNLEGRAAK